MHTTFVLFLSWILGILLHHNRDVICLHLALDCLPRLRVYYWVLMTPSRSQCVPYIYAYDCAYKISSTSWYTQNVSLFLLIITSTIDFIKGALLSLENTKVWNCQVLCLSYKEYFRFGHSSFKTYLEQTFLCSSSIGKISFFNMSFSTQCALIPSVLSDIWAVFRFRNFGDNSIRKKSQGKTVRAQDPYFTQCAQEHEEVNVFCGFIGL